MEIWSSYYHHETFPSYLVRVAICRQGVAALKTRYAADQGSFTRIDKAEAAHQDLVLRFTEQKGYKIHCSSVK